MPDRYASSKEIYRPEFGAVEPVGRSPAMRLRLKVFGATFLLCLLLGQGYNFSRSAVFEAQAKLQLDGPDGAASAAQGRQALLVEAELLGSRALIEATARQLQAQGFLPSLSGEAAVTAAQAMLQITPLDGALLLVQAHSSEPVLAAQLVNSLVENHRQAQVNRGQTATRTQLADTREELRIVSAKLDERRRQFEAYRQHSELSSTERDENPTVARLKGLSSSLAAATEREAIAAGRLRSIEQTMAEGRRVPLTKQGGIVADIEQRLSQQREEMRALERQFTPQYLELDPAARALKTRILTLEQQLDGEQQKQQLNALAEAREELAGSTATAQRLRRQITADRQAGQIASQQLGTAQAMQTELNGLQQMQQAVQQRLLGLEAGQAAQQPRLRLLQAATPPGAASAPHYGRDAALVLAGAMLMGFLAVWFVEFFNRRERVQLPAQTTLILPQPWPAASPDALDTRPQLGPPPHVRLPAHVPPALQLSGPLPRELQPQEVGKLLAAAAPCNLALLNCLLCGLSAEEAAVLELRHADLVRGELQVSGDGARSVPLTPAVRQYAEQCLIAASDDDAPLFQASGERALSPDDIEAIVTATAYDAHLDQPQSVTADCLRHTYVAFIVRQGLRFSELGGVVGRLGPEMLKALTTLAPQAQRISPGALERLLPLLQHSRSPAQPS